MGGGGEEGIGGGAVSVEEGFGAGFNDVVLPGEAADPGGAGLGSGGEIFAAADGGVVGLAFSGGFEVLEDLVGGLLSEGAEGGPFAADEAVDGEGSGGCGGEDFDMVAAGDVGGDGGVGGGEGAAAAEGEDDVLAGDVDAWEDAAESLEHVIDFGVVAGGGVGVGDGDIGGAHDDLVHEGEDDADAAIGVLVIDHLVGEGAVQIGAIDDEVGAFGGAHEAGGGAEDGVGGVDPGAGGVDEDLGFDGEGLSGGEVFEEDAAGFEALGCDVVEGEGKGVGLAGVVEEFDAEAFGLGDFGVVVGGGGDDVGVDAGDFGEGLVAGAEVMGGGSAVVSGDEVVEGESEACDEGAAFAWSDGESEEDEGGAEDAAEAGIEGDGGFQRADVVWSVGEEAVAFEQGFGDEGEFAVFEVAEAAVDHARGFGGSSGGEVVFVDEEGWEALEGEFAEEADAVDSTAEDEDGDLGMLDEVLDCLLSVIHLWRLVVCCLNGEG